LQSTLSSSSSSSCGLVFVCILRHFSRSLSPSLAFGFFFLRVCLLLVHREKEEKKKKKKKDKLGRYSPSSTGVVRRIFELLLAKDFLSYNYSTSISSSLSSYSSSSSLSSSSFVVVDINPLTTIIIDIA
jgi:hypothetical protein